MKTLKNVGKRAMALVLALMMCVGMLSTTAFAAKETHSNDKYCTLCASGNHDWGVYWSHDHPEWGTSVTSRICKCCRAEDVYHAACVEHKYEAVVTPPTCTKDGYTTYTCNKVSLGKVCGASYTTAYVKATGVHTQDSGTVTTAATCLHEGEKTFRCTGCDMVMGTETIAKDPSNHDKDCHVENDRGKNDTQHWNVLSCGATTNYENHSFVRDECEVCGYKKTTDPVNPPEHEHIWGEVQVEHPATCTSNAIGKQECTVPGCDASQDVEVEGSMLPHVYEGATCKTLGTCKNGCGQKGGELNPANHEGLSRLAWNDSEHMKVYECCNAVDESTRFAHDFTWEKVGDTYFGYCNGCLYERTDVVLPEHTCKFDGDWVVGNGYHWHNCTVYPGDCPGVQDKDEHSTTQGWVDNSDGTHKKVCDVCGATYETADHNWNAWVKVEGGYQRTCAGCGAVDTDTSKVTVDDGHDHTAYAVGVDAVAATCTETGLTAGVKCDLCDEWITEPTVTDALNHDFGDWYTVTAAQVGVAGLERHDCRREGCGASETRRIDPLPDTGTGGGDVVIDDTNPPLGGDPDGGDGEVELDDGEIPLAGPVTRAEFVDYLYRHEGSPDTALSTFVDVPADHEYASAIGWGQVNDIAWGISETEFAPDELVTVEQVKLFLSRYAAFKGSEMPELAALVGLDDQDPAMNCDEILGEFFGADE